MVGIELADPPEEKLHRLVEPGSYASLSEAVRDTVIDYYHGRFNGKRSRLYLDSDAGFHYITYCTEACFEKTIQYEYNMLQHRYTTLHKPHKLGGRAAESIVNRGVYARLYSSLCSLIKTSLLNTMSTLKRRRCRLYTSIDKDVDS